MTQTFLTRQQILDRAVAHVRQQGGSASTPAGCVYRREDGRKCAIGALIPDNAYDPIFDGYAATDALSLLQDVPSFAAALRAGGVDPTDAAFLSDLQSAHDALLEQASETSIYSAFSYVAAKYGLVYLYPPA